MNMNAQKKNVLEFLSLVFLLYYLICSLPYQSAFAVEPDEILQNTTLEKRARAISSGLRCLVCQNQSIDDSDAPLAKDLRVLVRERLSAGDADQLVIDYVVQRYGEFVLLKPPFNMHTVLLWFSPVLLCLFCFLLLWKAAKSRSPKSESELPLSEKEEKELGQILLQTHHKNNPL